MRRHSPFIALAAGLAAAALVAGCSSGSSDSGSSSAPASESATATGGGEVDTMTWAIQSPIASMDVAKGVDVPTLRAQAAAFDRVIAQDDEGNFVPGVTSFATPDPQTIVLTLRDGVTFWDGSPVTAEDVAYSIERHTGADSTSLVGQYFSAVESVEVTDPKTVTIKLSRPDPSMLTHLAVYAFVRQQAYDEAAGEAAGGPDKPGMGTGPFSIVSYSSADGAVLAANDNYWGGKPKVKELKIVSIADPETARLALSSGEIDGFFDVPLIATRQWDELDNATITYVPGSYIDYLVMDTTRAPFDDINARIAMAHLLDRAALTQPLFNGRAAVATSIVPAIQMEATFGADAATIEGALPAVPEFSIDKAREALAKSATPDGFSDELPVDTTQPWMSPLAQNLAETAKQIGIEITVKPVPAADWVAGLLDPAASPLQLLAFAGATTWAGELPPVMVGEAAPFNVARYSTPEADPLVGAVASATTPEELKQPLQDLLTNVNTNLPYVPLFTEDVATAIGNDFVWDGGYSYFAIGQAWPMKISGAQ
jgi:peptide/nickel transport system substrate-binding protein